MYYASPPHTTANIAIITAVANANVILEDDLVIEFGTITTMLYVVPTQGWAVPLQPPSAFVLVIIFIIIIIAMASSPLVIVSVVVYMVDTASCCSIALLCPPPPPSHCVVHHLSTPSS